MTLTYCGVCGEKHKPHAPDNVTVVPVCQKCWTSAGPNTRIYTLMSTRLESSVFTLTDKFCQLLDAVVEATGREDRQRKKDELN